MKPLAASLLEALDYDSSDDSDFKVGDASGKCFLSLSLSQLSAVHCIFNFLFFEPVLIKMFIYSKSTQTIYFDHLISHISLRSFHYSFCFLSIFTQMIS